MEFRLGQKEDPIYIINIYNAPLRSDQAGISAKQVMTLMQKNSIIMEDINLHYTDWDNHTRNPSIQAKECADWISDNHATYKFKVDKIMYVRDGTLDLVISSNTITDQITEFYFMPELHTISDYKTLLICIEIKVMAAKKQIGVQFWFEKMDEKQFYTSLEGQCRSLDQA